MMARETLHDQNGYARGVPIPSILKEGGIAFEHANNSYSVIGFSKGQHNE